MNNIISLDKPAKYKHFDTIASRLETFTHWPQQPATTPSRLAEAGFVFSGHRDMVFCYHCDGALWNWVDHDDPIKEHAKYFPSCYYIQFQQQKIQETPYSFWRICLQRYLISKAKCKVCFINQISHAFLPCGHFVICATCAPRFETCPICRTKVEGAVRTFML